MLRVFVPATAVALTSAVALWALSRRRGEGAYDDQATGELDPVVAAKARALVARAKEERIELVVVSGWRSLKEQARLYAKGRTAPGEIVTSAKPGQSWHNYGLAFDVAVIDDKGHPSWPDDPPLWHAIGALGESLGLQWGGTFGDFGHFEFHPGLTIADAKAGKVLS